MNTTALSIAREVYPEIPDDKHGDDFLYGIIVEFTTFEAAHWAAGKADAAMKITKNEVLCARAVKQCMDGKRVLFESSNEDMTRENYKFIVAVVDRNYGRDDFDFYSYRITHISGGSIMLPPPNLDDPYDL